MDFFTSVALYRENEATKFMGFVFTIVAPKSAGGRRILNYWKTCPKPYPGGIVIKKATV